MSQNRTVKNVHKWIHALMLAALLAGLVPPPLVRTVLPQPAAALAEALLPAPAVVQAAPLAQSSVEIGNTVWQDTNSNGLQDSGEPGIPNVTVGLYDSSGNAVLCPQPTTANLALNQTATQSGLFSAGSEADKAVDGSTSNASITANMANSWWQVDLGQSAVLHQVVIYPWVSSHAQAEQIYVQVSNQPFASTNLAATLADPNVWSSALQGAWTGASLTVAIPTYTGRYVRIQHDNTNYLSLAEVQVFGDPMPLVTAVTDASGHYTFTSASCVQPNTAYQVQIDTTQMPLIGMATVTTQDAGGVTSNDPSGDDSDSDASQVTLSGKPTAVINLTTPAAGVNYSYDFGFAPNKGTLIVRKATLPAGSSQSFAFTSNVPGHASFTLSSGGSYTMTNVDVGTYRMTETVASGWTQVSATCTSGSTQTGLVAISVQWLQTTTCTVVNALPLTPSNVLTVTKTVSGTGSGPFSLSVRGPSGYLTTTTINGGQTKLFTGLSAGVYTVTEASPGAGWVTTYTVGSTTSATHGVVTLSSPTIAPTTAGPISGNVYRDFDADGVDDGANEIGVVGVVVTAYDRDGVMRGSATTDANGNYSFTPTSSGPYRLELTNLPASYYPTMHGTNNGTSTQFVTANDGATNVNFGVNVPCDYCQANPQLAVPTQRLGPLVSSPAVASFPYGGGATVTFAPYDQIGTTWGEAYRRETKTLLLAAMERAGGLPGPLGIGGIYEVNPATGSVTPFADLKAYGVDVGVSMIPVFISSTGLWTPNYNAGKIGIGDIDLSTDGKTLYVMSLNTKELIGLDVATKQLTQRTAVPDPGCLDSRTTPPTPAPQDVRPWAIEVDHGDVYIGVSCSGETSQLATDGKAYVMQLNAGAFTPFYGPIAIGRWSSPTDLSPLSAGEWLSDIDFDVDGSFFLSFTYRVLYTTSTCCSPAHFANRMLKVGSGAATFNPPTLIWQSAAHLRGASALVPGRGQVVVTTADVQVGNTQIGDGAVGLNATTGIGEWVANGITNYTNVYTKGGAMGDIEALCDPAPLEIGNRVWNDLNGNGVQDPGEPGFANVTVSLQGPTNTVTTNTDANGLYYFNVRPNTAYTLTINPSQAPLAGLSLTQVNLQAISGNPSSNDPILDTRDSDAVLVGSTPTLYYTTGLAGQNNHGLDFGFAQPVSGQVDILNIAPAPVFTPTLKVSKSLNGVNPFSVGQSISFTIRITNTGNITLTTLPLEDRFSSAFMSYQSATPSPSVVNGGILRWSNLLAADADGLGPGEALVVEVFFTTGADTTLLTATVPCTGSGHTPNIARVVNALAGSLTVVADADDVDCAAVQILNPTAVQLAERSLTQTTDGVLVRWQMVDESNIVGFYIWKSNGVDSSRRSELIATQLNGQSGTAAAYEWLDAGAVLSRDDVYILEIVKTDGSSERVVVDVVNRGSLFLPLIVR